MVIEFWSAEHMDTECELYSVIIYFMSKCQSDFCTLKELKDQYGYSTDRKCSRGKVRLRTQIKGSSCRCVDTTYNESLES